MHCDFLSNKTQWALKEVTNLKGALWGINKIQYSMHSDMVGVRKQKFDSQQVHGWWYKGMHCDPFWYHTNRVPITYWNAHF